MAKPLTTIKIPLRHKFSNRQIVDAPVKYHACDASTGALCQNHPCGVLVRNFNTKNHLCKLLQRSQSATLVTLHHKSFKNTPVMLQCEHLKSFTFRLDVLLYGNSNYNTNIVFQSESFFSLATSYMYSKYR